jgi:hypothetical protein
VRVDRIAEGLWRWTARHPEWQHGDPWPHDVGCIYYEAPEAVVLVDPLVPADPRDGLRFWRALDRDVERLARPVVVVLTTSVHERSAVTVCERYGATTVRPGADTSPPAGVRAFEVPDWNESVLWLAEHRALVPGDSLVGDGAGGVTVIPEAWLPQWSTAAGLAERLRPLLELPVERVLVSHGEPVLADGHAALSRALAPHADAPSAA